MPGLGIEGAGGPRDGAYVAITFPLGKGAVQFNRDCLTYSAFWQPLRFSRLFGLFAQTTPIGNKDGAQRWPTGLHRGLTEWAPTAAP
jgi:hypothetical protein